MALSDTITKKFSNENNEIQVIMLDAALESHLLTQAQEGKLDRGTLSLTSSNVEKLYKSASECFSKMLQNGFEPPPAYFPLTSLYTL